MINDWLNYILYSIYFPTYAVVPFLLVFTSKTIMSYFIMEIQWMLLIIFFILDNSIWRGILTYFIMNAIPSILLIIGILMSNSLFSLIGCFGKIGYFPFFLVLAYLLFSTPYLFSMLDIFNKWAYLCSFLVIWHGIIGKGLFLKDWH